MQTITVSLYGDNTNGQNFIASVKAYDILITKRWHGYDEISIKAYADSQNIINKIGGNNISDNAIRWMSLRTPLNTNEFYKVAGLKVESFNSNDIQKVTITGTDPRSWLYETMGSTTSSEPTMTGTPSEVIKNILGRCSEDSEKFGVPNGWSVPIINATNDTISNELPTDQITIRNYDPDCPGKAADEFFSLFPDFSAMLKPIDGKWQWYVIKRPTGVNGKKLFSQESKTAVIQSVSVNYTPSDAIAISSDKIGTYNSTPIFASQRGIWRMVKSLDVNTNGLSDDDATALCASYAKQLSRNTPYGHVQVMLDYTRFISSANVGEIAALRVGSLAYDIPVNEIAYGFNNDSGWLSKAFVDADLLMQSGDDKPQQTNYKGIIVRLGSGNNSNEFWEKLNFGLKLYSYDPVNYYLTHQDGKPVLSDGYNDKTIYEEKANWLIANGLATKVKDSPVHGQGALYETSLKYTIFCNGKEIFNGKLRFSNNIKFEKECTNWSSVGIQGDDKGFTERTNKLCIFPSDYEPDDYNGWAIPLNLSIFSRYLVGAGNTDDVYISEIIQCKPSWFITDDMINSGNLNGYKMVDRFNANGKVEIGVPFGSNIFRAHIDGEYSMLGNSKEHPCTIHQDFMSEFPNEIKEIGDGFMAHAFESSYLTTGVVNPIPKNATSFGTDFMRNMYQDAVILAVDGMTESEMSNITMATLPDGFRVAQFLRTDMPTAINETIPDSITKIGDNFRKSQYEGSTISKTAVETLPSKLVSIGKCFRISQFKGCSSLSDAGTEAEMPSTVTIIGREYSSEKFAYCSALSNVQIEKVPPRTDIGEMLYFRQFEYEYTPIKPGNVILRGTLTDNELIPPSEWPPSGLAGLRDCCFEGAVANSRKPILYEDGSNVIPNVNAISSIYG